MYYVLVLHTYYENEKQNGLEGKRVGVKIEYT